MKLVLEPIWSWPLVAVVIGGLLAMVLGLYVIFHTLSVSIVERVREVATLHALGTTRAQVGRVFFVEATCIAVAAGVSP